MSIAEHLPALAIAVDETFKRLAFIRDRLSMIDYDRHGITIGPKHTDHIVAEKMRELDAACVRFRGRTQAQSESSTMSLSFLLSDPDAHVYYNRSQIAAAIPSEVERLYPNAKNAMRETERNTAISALDAERTALRAEEDTLMSEIVALRRIVLP